MTSPTTNKKPKYTKMSQLEHVLKRSDMYVGSTRPQKSEEYILVGDNFSDEKNQPRIEKKEIVYSPAVLRVFIEPLSNIIDNVTRSRISGNPVTEIKIDIEKNGKIIMWNDGDIIPIEMNDEHKCYNHSLIFGQLLSSSNYDDSEDRIDISGKNGVGGKACLARGSIVPLFTGDFVKVEDVKVGNFLIGDDGTPRKVLATTEGRGKMYEVSQDRADSYIVNENHTLTVRMADHKVIFWDNTRKAWGVLWVDKKDKKIHTKHFFSEISSRITCPECDKTLSGNLGRHYERMHKGLSVPKKQRANAVKNAPNDESVHDALEKMKEFVSEIPNDNTLDINIQDYMKLPETMKWRFSGFVGECVQWQHRDIALDPYILGLWLGDGVSMGRAFASDYKNDPEIIDYIKKWGEMNDATIKECISNRFLHTISSTTKSGKNPLSKLLRKYNLINNKHIPQEYIVNSKEIRLAVLAGIIDTDGTVMRNGTRVTITQGLPNQQVAHDIVILARSLGFRVCTQIKSTQWIWEGEKRQGLAITVNISGEGLQDIPTLLPRKKCAAPKRHEVKNVGSLKIKQIDDGDYVGIQVDGNNRFVLEDFTVTHNCNIFATQFEVEGVDLQNKKKLIQTWTDNMTKTEEPTITSIKKKDYPKAYTKVSFLPDFARLGLETENNLTEDIISMFKKYVVDMAMLTKTDVFLNGEKIPVTNLEEYSLLYRNESTDEILSIKTDKCEVVLYPSENDSWRAISFANGVCTKLGGVHVDAWAEALFRPFVEKLNKPKIPPINIKDVKQYFNIFVVASVIRPEFESQSKYKLEAPIVVADVKKSHLSTMYKWSVMESLQDLIKTKEFSVLKKTERKKGYVKIEGLDSANFEGGKRATECILILTEGDSAKTFAVQGIETGAFGKKGRDFFGILPLRGKILNTRSATMKSIGDNKVIDSIIKAIGLKMDVDYLDDDNYRKLRYGMLMSLTDQDDDGLHITGLILNLLDSLFPSLMKRDPPFMAVMHTPIVKVNLPKNKSLTFYDEREFFKYRDDILEKNPKAHIEKKYYKGLGTWGNKGVMEAFGKKIFNVIYDDNAPQTMKKAFHVTQANVRKQWIADYNSESGGVKWNGDEDEIIEFPLSEFIDKELIKFSIADCQRSLPHIMDGLKVSQRKILFGAIKKKLDYNIPESKNLRVAQLGGYVSETTNYHHGEQNLYETIIKMAQTYVGSNNISLLFPNGQFGTVSQLGKDASKPRYIYTKLDMLTRLIFREEDDELLTMVQDDGNFVEPENYLPIIPMILVNGCEGIGTGWSSSIPLYNPLEIIGAVKIWLENDGKVIFTSTEEDNNNIPFSLLPDLTPWYRGWNGEITKHDKKKDTYVSWGKIDVSDKIKKKKNVKECCKITEIPIGMSIDGFKEYLDSLLENKQIIGYENQSKPNVADFTVFESEDGLRCSLENLKLYRYIHTSNMVMYDCEGKIRKFENVQEIIDYFCTERYKHYFVRKQKMLDGYNEKIPMLENKYRFISEILSGEFSMRNDKGNAKKMSAIEEELEEKKYDKMANDSHSPSYDYLLQMPIKSQTEERLESLKKEMDNIKEKRDILMKTSEKQLWINDLDELAAMYPKWADETRKNDFECVRPPTEKKKK